MRKSGTSAGPPLHPMRWVSRRLFGFQRRWLRPAGVPRIAGNGGTEKEWLEKCLRDGREEMEQNEGRERGGGDEFKVWPKSSQKKASYKSPRACPSLNLCPKEDMGPMSKLAESRPRLLGPIVDLGQQAALHTERALPLA